MATGVAAEEAKGPQPVTKTTRTRPAEEQATAGTTRFFLAKTGAHGGPPAIDRELATEGEAMIESLKTSLSYYRIVELRATADFTGKNPQVRSEAVKRQG